MKHKIKTTKIEEVNLSGITEYAIMKYDNALRLEARAEEAREEATALFLAIPKDEQGHYVRITTSIDDKY